MKLPFIEVYQTTYNIFMKQIGSIVQYIYVCFVLIKKNQKKFKEHTILGRWNWTSECYFQLQFILNHS